MGNNKLEYAIDCVTTTFDTRTTYKWPYTFDFSNSNNLCNEGSLPTEEFIGIYTINRYNLFSFCIKKTNGND